MAADLTPEYAKALGRIGGQLLADNLQNFEDSQGGDISFDTDLLYVDVANKRIGLNNYGASPAELYVGGNNILTTVGLKVDNYFYNNNWTVNSNTISNATGPINIVPNQSSNPTIIASGVGVAGINFTASTGFYTPTSNTNINLVPSGTGITSVTGDVQVNGASTLVSIAGTGLVSGNLFANSTINIGDQTTDTVSFTAELTSSLVPSVNNVDNLGSPSLNWNNLYATTAAGVTSTNTSTLNAGGIQFTGNTISSIDPTKDITFIPQGTGNVKLNNFYPFNGNNVVNSTPQVFSLNSTGDGYWDFNNVSALVIASGTTAQRINPAIGTTRYNTDLQYLEIYNGTTWQNAVGAGASTSASTAADLSVIYDLILG